MQIVPVRRSVSPFLRALLVAAVLALCFSAVALAALGTSRPQLGGKWSGRYGGAVSGSFTLTWKQTGTKLSGTITLSNPHGTYGIGGIVNRTSISFGAVQVGATYTGSLSASGKSMSGHWKSPQGGGSWSDHKAT
jgi:hypothetical protein